MPNPDLICFSHLRWDSGQAVQPRLRLLLERAARDRRVFFIEDPSFDDARPHLSFRRTADGVVIGTPTLPRGTGPRRGSAMQRELIDHLVAFHDITRFVLWFWNPAAIAFTDHLAPAATIYEVLDDAAPRRYPPVDAEQQILAAADVVFAVTPALYHHHRASHSNVHQFASSAATDPAAWDRIWTAMERQIGRAVDARQVSPIAAAK